MTTEQNTNQDFAWIAQYGGPVVDWADAPRRHHVLGEGLADWFASEYDGQDGKPLDIRKHVEQANGMRMLELSLARHIAPGAKPQVRWHSTLKVNASRYVRVSGEAADFPTALEQVESHVHESRQLGGLIWWRESADRWISWLGAFTLSAVQLTGAREEPSWHFQVSGEAPTLEEAALLATMGRHDMRSTAADQGT